MRKFSECLICFIFNFFLCSIAFAQEVNYKKLGIEESSVEDLTPLPLQSVAPDFLLTIDGMELMLSEFVKNNRVVLIFYRGDWCPVCNRHLEAFQKDLSKLSSENIEAIAVVPQQQEYINNTVKKTGLEIPIVYDNSGRIMEDYQVAFKVTKRYQKMIKVGLGADIAETNGAEIAILPVPATYVIDHNMKIQFVHFDPNYKVRASIDEILNSILDN